MDKFVYVIVAAAIILLHALATLTKGNVSKLLAYVNIFLHICLFFGLMILKAKLEILAISFMYSLFVYLLFSYAVHYFSVKRREREDSEL